VVTVFQSAWPERYHPAELYAAILNNQPMVMSVIFEELV